MKKNFLKLSALFIVLLTVTIFVACEKDEANPGHEDSMETPGILAASAAKIDVCHYDADNDTWHLINISQNAWNAHAAHGDVRLDDQDGDGYVPNNACEFGNMGDCDDNDASINPGATEVCDGLDNNCNGNVDEGVTTTFYADSDGDGYGDAAITTQACEAPAGYVADNTDCDDNDASINPGATEACNDGLDNDCDGLVDGDDDDCGNPDLIEYLEDADCIYHNHYSNRVGQTFTTGSQSKTLLSISEKISGTCGGNGGGMFLVLYEFNTGTNSFTYVAKSNTIGINVGVKTFNFQSLPVLQANTTYAFMNANTGGNFYYPLGKVEGTYSGGSAFKDSPGFVQSPVESHIPIYNAQAFDLWFQVNLQ